MNWSGLPPPCLLSTTRVFDSGAETWRDVPRRQQPLGDQVISTVLPLSRLSLIHQALFFSHCRLALPVVGVRRSWVKQDSVLRHDVFHEYDFQRNVWLFIGRDLLNRAIGLS